MTIIDILIEDLYRYSKVLLIFLIQGSSGSVAMVKKMKGLNNNKSSSIPRRKSSASESCKRDSISMNILPDNLPENEDVWRQYSEESRFKTILNNYKINEDEIVNKYSTYLDSIKTLNVLRNNIEMKRNELLEVLLS